MHVKVEYWLSLQKQALNLVDWLVIKNGSADVFDPSAVGSTQ